MNEKYYTCTIIRRLDKKTIDPNIRFENFSYSIKKKINQNRKALVYSCLLTRDELDEISKFNSFLRISTVSNHEYDGDLYEIYCDSGVYNHGKDQKNLHIKASAIAAIIYKNGKEIHRITELFTEFADNNIMEIFAFIKALRYLQNSISSAKLKNSKIIVSSDSQILQEFIIKRTAIDNVLSKCNTDLNNDSTFYTMNMILLLKELFYYLNFLDIYSRWTKGHNRPAMNNKFSIKMNIECDTLCKQIIKNGVSRYKMKQSKISIKKEKKQKRKLYSIKENFNYGQARC